MWLIVVVSLGVVGLVTLKIVAKITCGRYKIKHDLTGKSILITGANSGIGLEMGLRLAEMGGTVHLACRDEERGRAALRKVEAVAGPGRAFFWSLDLSRLQSVRNFAHSFIKSGARLNILINNAGVGGVRKCQRTVDGLELTMATNHYGHFLLTNLLLDKLKAESKSRIVVVSSLGHLFASLPLDDLDYSEGYWDWGIGAYIRSKLANLMFVTELSRRLQGTDVTVNAIHPGAVQTGLFRSFPTWLRPALAIMLFFFKTAEEGAESGLHAALAEELDGVSGLYLWDCQPASVNPLVKDAAKCKALWDISAQVTGLS